MISSPVSAPPAPIVPGTGFEVTSYALALTPDLANKTISGREVITLRSTEEGLRQLDFSPNALIIDEATIENVYVNTRQMGGVLSFDLPRPLPQWHTVKLTIAYHGKPARGLATSVNALYSSFFACDWMVCLQDRFGDKSAFSLDLHAPAGIETLSVGALVSRRLLQDRSEIWSWRTPRRYSAYLYGFALAGFTGLAITSATPA